MSKPAIDTIRLPQNPSRTMSIDFQSEEERAVVKAEQIRAFYSETNDQNLAGALVLSLLVYVVHDGVPGWTWQPALLALYVVTLVRAWLVWQYHRAPTRRVQIGRAHV